MGKGGSGEGGEGHRLSLGWAGAEEQRRRGVRWYIQVNSPAVATCDAKHGTHGEQQPQIWVWGRDGRARWYPPHHRHEHPPRATLPTSSVLVMDTATLEDEPNISTSTPPPSPPARDVQPEKTERGRATGSRERD
jgi:hypothetical protein